MTAPLSRRLRRLLDAVMYGLAVTAVMFVVGAALGLGFVLVFGGGDVLITVKFWLFLVGILMFGYSTFQLRPSRPWKTEEGEDGKLKVTRTEPKGEVVGAREETTFQATIQRIPPLSWYSLPPDQRWSVGAKLFVASLVVLLTSFTMEFVFGVRV
ncbi:DUF7555 family protein [Halorussus halophilus]|uniref:DUF7555 family protein n=1 Tax=Halorussus halophilus TaxID=2650975 RepID=UPI00130174D4|nr:hypothetical protein [Halorussus halophilus]